MATWAIYALSIAGCAVVCVAGLWLLYRAGKAAGASAEQAKTATAGAAIERRRSEVLQKEVTRDQVVNDLENGTY